MPSEEFYIYVGGIGGAVAFMGFFMSTADPGGTNAGVRAAGSFAFMGGLFMLLIVLGGALYDIYKRVRGWRLDQREDDLYYKEKEIAVKQKEAELKRKEREAREEEKRRAQREEYRRKTESQREERSGHKEKQSSSSTHTQEETASGFESEKGEFKEKAWFWTGSKDPEDLKKKQEQTDSKETSTPKSGLEKETQSEKDYKYQISLDKHLMLLWTLYKTKEHEFLTRNQLVLAANGGQKGNRDPWYDAISDLENMDLLKRINEKEYAGKEPEWGNRITDTGLLLIRKARSDQVTRLENFKEKYAIYLRR